LPALAHSWSSQLQLESQKLTQGYRQTKSLFGKEVTGAALNTRLVDTRLMTKLQTTRKAFVHRAILLNKNKDLSRQQPAGSVEAASKKFDVT
jgi:Lon protease-like protein